MNPSMPTRVGSIFDKATACDGRQETRVMIVSDNLEHRRPINKILEALSIDVTCCSNVAQTEQVLALQRPNLIFCEERLPDGGYVDVLNLSARISGETVVLTRTGDWDLYMEATRRGAFDVIRGPWCATDIELILIRAIREQKHGLSKSRTNTAQGSSTLDYRGA
jgi:DNA-binding NtrC family response regulator